MPRKALIAANWKMYKTPAEAKAFVDAFLPLVAGHDRDEIALFPIAGAAAHGELPHAKGSQCCRRLRRTFTLPRKALTPARPP